MIDREFLDDRYCFACGEDNPAGLHLDINADSGKCEVNWMPEKRFQGYSGVLHGGIISTLMDETMAYAAISLVGAAATGEISVRFRKPVKTDCMIRVTARVTERKGRLLLTEAELLQDGNRMASATARFLDVER